MDLSLDSPPPAASKPKPKKQLAGMSNLPAVPEEPELIEDSADDEEYHAGSASKKR
jgi:hypothetical protein